MIEDSKEYDVKRLQQLLDAIADDSLTDEGEKELQVILKGSKEARKTYLEFTHMIDSLHWSYAENAVDVEDIKPPRVQVEPAVKEAVKFP
ncbi:MAG: hypothetical protein MK132_26490, partial [Lentisphaerales bacterium]|nr:hypothetical protein [Lentisphaerales bacterium]